MDQRIILTTILAGLFFEFADGRTIFLEIDAPTDIEISYLKKYGYLSDSSDSSDGLDGAYTAQSISTALYKLQAFAGIRQTGELDQDTRELFKKKRCGVKDIEDSSSRRRRYVLQQAWNHTVISYRVMNGSSTLDKSHIEELMATSFDVWAPHGNLQFVKEDSGHADINIAFVSGDHGDGFPFDGPGRVVAHAFPPPHGDMHFDDEEVWGIDPTEQQDDVTDFFAVAVHEVGHALGLSHSPVRSSVMYPYYQVPVERLHQDDILGMRDLYLKERLGSTHAPAAVRFTKAADELPDLCYTNYDAVQVLQQHIYVFEEEWVWKLYDRREVAEGWPRRIHHMFRGLPARVDSIHALYQMRNGNIRVFSSRKYWEFDSSFSLTHKGRIAEYGLPADVEELTTVFVSSHNNKTYLIDSERFWRYDESTGTMDHGYPKDMSAWRDVPAPVDSALVWKGDTYFFSGPRFWRFDDELVRAHEYYPLPTAQVWFPCPTSDDMDRYTANEEP